MSTEFIKHKPRAERINILHANAQKRIDYSYFKPLTEDELNEQKEIYFHEMGLIDLEQQKLDEAKAEFKFATDIPSKTAKDAYAVIKAKGIAVIEEVYLIPNYDTSMMDYINEAGEVVFSRRMLQEERQMMLKVSSE